MDDLTIPQLEIMMEAMKLKELDRDYREHLQAWLNFVVTGKKKVGKGKMKPVFKRFTQFFDYKSRLSKLNKKTTTAQSGRFSALSKKMKKDREEMLYAGEQISKGDTER